MSFHEDIFPLHQDQLEDSYTALINKLVLPIMSYVVPPEPEAHIPVVQVPVDQPQDNHDVNEPDAQPQDNQPQPVQVVRRSTRPSREPAYLQDYVHSVHIPFTITCHMTV